MATAVLLNPEPLCCYSPSSTALSVFQPNAITMHVTRPKSAKGRRRSTFSYSGTTDTYPCGVPSSPLAPHDVRSGRRASPTKAVFPAGQVSPEEIPELLQQVPLRSSSSLNKYRVLPSIGRKGLEAAAQQSDHLGASCGQQDAQKTAVPSEERGSPESCVPSEESLCAPEMLGRKMRQQSPLLSTLSLEEPCLLLAIRSPSGQRFEHHFKPTDSLQTVLEMAEHQTAARYERCSIETTEVPRRSFHDLGRSLQECGIPHKSVLCIRQAEQQDADP
ncbi:UBX domain-containing protein 10 [Cyrtonyx montezumae]|uniref:UBX domain-containing protein 10 n=1 Tax=Cyrtonyx montezumae TaxID=9017 RepID=UPI0032DBF365